MRFIKNAGKVGKTKHVYILDELERHRKYDKLVGGVAGKGQCVSLSPAPQPPALRRLHKAGPSAELTAMEVDASKLS